MVQRLLHTGSRGALPEVDIYSLQSFCYAQVRVKGEIKPVQPSFYDDIIRLPDIIEKVQTSKLSNMLPPKVGLVQERTVRTLEEVQSYLGSWKFYKNLWKFNKAETCERFLERGPSCVDFDEKLLYYSLLERQVRNISYFVFLAGEGARGPQGVSVFGDLPGSNQADSVGRNSAVD